MDILVIGAGTMGNGIAQACAVSGIDAVMIDVAETAVMRGLATITGSLDRLVRKEKIKAADKDAALLRIKGSTVYEDLAAAAPALIDTYLAGLVARPPRRAARTMPRVRAKIVCA